MNNYVISDADTSIKTRWIVINEHVQQTCREIMNIIKKVHSKHADFQVCVHQNTAAVCLLPPVAALKTALTHVPQHMQQEFREN